MVQGCSVCPRLQVSRMAQLLASRDSCIRFVAAADRLLQHKDSTSAGWAFLPASVANGVMIRTHSSPRRSDVIHSYCSSQWWIKQTYNIFQNKVHLIPHFHIPVYTLYMLLAYSPWFRFSLFGLPVSILNLAVSSLSLVNILQTSYIHPTSTHLIWHWLITSSSTHSLHLFHVLLS